MEWQKKAVDQANHFILFQPVYQIAVRNTIKDFPLTAAGWMLDLHGVTPAGAAETGRRARLKCGHAGAGAARARPAG